MNTRGQNLVEYILLVVAILIVMIAFLKPGGPYQKTLETNLNAATIDQINKISTEIKFATP